MQFAVTANAYRLRRCMAWRSSRAWSGGVARPVWCSSCSTSSSHRSTSHSCSFDKHRGMIGSICCPLSNVTSLYRVSTVACAHSTDTFLSENQSNCLGFSQSIAKHETRSLGAHVAATIGFVTHSLPIKSRAGRYGNSDFFVAARLSSEFLCVLYEWIKFSVKRWWMWLVESAAESSRLRSEKNEFYSVLNSNWWAFEMEISHELCYRLNNAWKICRQLSGTCRAMTSGEKNVRERKRIVNPAIDCRASC